MSKMGGVLVVVLSLIAGFGGGYGYNALVGGQSAAPTTSSTASTSTASTQSLEDCLKEVWGTDKYAAITANSSLATTEDNFSALTCYQSK